VLLLPEDGAPTVFQQGESYTLSESPDEEDLWPDAPTSEHAQATISMDSGEETPSTESTAPSDGSVEIDPSGDGIEAFAAMYIREAEGAQVPKETLFQARTRPGLTSTILRGQMRVGSVESSRTSSSMRMIGSETATIW